MTDNVFRGLIRRWLPLVFLIPLAYLLRPIFWTPLDYRFYNYFHSKRTAPVWDDVVVVEIDNATRETVFEKPVYPLSRHVAQHARLTRQLDAARVRAIVFDLQLNEDVLDSSPTELVEAFQSAGNVYLVTTLTGTFSDRPDEGGQYSLQGSAPLPELVTASEGVFAVDVRVDPDGVLRRFHPSPAAKQLGLESLPERLAGVQAEKSVPIDFPSETSPIPAVSYRDVLNSPEAVAAKLEGRVAFVGSVLDESIDYVSVPRPQMTGDGERTFLLPGVTVLAAITETLLDGMPIRDAAWPVVLLWNVLWSMLAVAVTVKRKPIRSTLFLIVALGGAAVVTGLLHSFAGYVFPAGLLVGCVVVVGAHSMIYAHFQTSRELIVTLQRSRDELEEKVKERTRELSAANVELEATLKALKTAQADLVQSQKMASLGRLSAGIAHEINNPIGAVNSGADVSQRCIEKLSQMLETSDLRDTDELQRVLQIMKNTNQATTDAAQRIAKVVESLKRFSRLDDTELQKADVHEGIDSTLTLLNRDLEDRVDVSKDYGDIPEIECYPAELNQVFMNILHNAIRAIDKRGEIRIRTFADPESIHVEISDTGLGVPTEHMDKIFDPGFTTWGVGVGTGLGLAISHNIIEKHNGQIRVESAPGRGATFTITLPLRSGAPSGTPSSGRS